MHQSHIRRGLTISIWNIENSRNVLELKKDFRVLLIFIHEYYRIMKF